MVPCVVYKALLGTTRRNMRTSGPVSKAFIFLVQEMDLFTKRQ